MYNELQQKVYENKLNKGFNVTSVNKEIVLMAEEFGELCDAYITDNDAEIIDAIGDLMIYCLGLCAMLKADSDKIINKAAEQPERVQFLQDYFPYVGRELGMLAKKYRRAKKTSIEDIEGKDELVAILGRLMGYCSLMFKYVKADEMEVLEEIISNNAARNNQIKI
jgi:NTP pyrophosphatase (non-canonical NTP hydrolase)